MGDKRKKNSRFADNMTNNINYVSPFYVIEVLQNKISNIITFLDQWNLVMSHNLDEQASRCLLYI